MAHFGTSLRGFARMGVVATALLAQACASSAAEIEVCDGLYRYIDVEFMRARASKGCFAMGGLSAGSPLGWTWSSTPPNADVESIEEIATICHGQGPVSEVVISHGRKIPRYRLIGKPHEFGNYVRPTGTDRQVACQSVSFTPPPSARRPTPEAIDRAGSFVFGPVLEGPITSTPTTSIVAVERKLLQLYGVVQQPGMSEAVWQLVGLRPVRCQEVDLGGFRCLMNGEDLSLFLAARGLVRPHTSAPLRIRAAFDRAPAPVAAKPLSAAERAQQRKCVSLADAVTRSRRRAEIRGTDDGRLAEAQARYTQTCTGRGS